MSSPQCLFTIDLGGGWWGCENPGCGKKCKSKERPVFTNSKCRSGEAKPPSIAGKALGYTAAVAKWIAAGSPTRDTAEVSRIFTELCQPCDRFKATADGAGSCAKCGCALRKAGSGLVNKIAMATEKCPVGKW